MKRIFTTLFFILCNLLLFGQVTPEVKIGEQSYADIKTAISAAVDGDVISIRGQHDLTQTIAVNKSITLLGSNRTEDILNGTNTFRILNVTGATVTIQNLTIQNGNAGTTSTGGGILAFDTEHLTLKNVRVTSNSAKNGGGISVGGTSLTLENCEIDNNETSSTLTNGLGGGLFVIGRNSGLGGVTISISKTLIDNNIATKNGGGISYDPNGVGHTVDFVIENSILSNNSASEGGGLYVKSFGSTDDVNTAAVSVLMNHVTMVHNTATVGSRHGVYFFRGNSSIPMGILNIYNSIIALNADGAGHDINFGATNTQNLVNTIIGLTTNKNATYVANEVNVTTGANEGNLELSENLELIDGAFIRNYSITALSIAKDYNADNTLLLTVDASGQERDDKPDAGAFEFIPEPFDPVNTVFNSTTETQYYTIQEAIDEATAEDVITINGAHKENIEINKSLTLQGDDATQDILSGTKDDDIAAGSVIKVSGGDINVILKNFTVQKGKTEQQGGGILANNVTGDILLDHMIIKENESVKHGGGVAAIGANMTIQFTTFENNQTTSTGEQFGGGLFASPSNSVMTNSKVVVTSSTFNNNLAARSGGAIGIDGRYQNNYALEVELENLTLVNNEGAVNGGVIYARGNNLMPDELTSNITLSIDHSTIAYNTSGGAAKGLLFRAQGDKLVNLNLSNSIISGNYIDAGNDIDFTGTNATVTNTFLGKVAALPEDGLNNALNMDDHNYDLELANELSDQGGVVQVVTIGQRSAALDFAEGSTVALDAVGGERKGIADAGAFEGEKEPFDEVNTVFNTTTNTQYYSIQEAIDEATAEDVITINGTHKENIEINKSLTLQGDDATQDILSGTKDDDIAAGSVIKVSGGDINVTLKNFTVQKGKTEQQGGGILANNIIGEVLLDHMIIRENESVKHGGGVAAIGANMTIQFSTIEGNTTTSTGEQFGGGLFAAPSNSNGADSKVVMISSTINNNTTAKSGAGIGIDGRYASDFALEVELENVTIFGNISDGNAGAIYARGNDLTTDLTKNNVTLSVDHSTIAHNNSSGSSKGLLFKGQGSQAVNFTLSNSIISANGTDAQTDISFVDTKAMVSNSFLGKVVNLPTENISNVMNIDNSSYNLQLAEELSEEGGAVKVLIIGEQSDAIDFALTSTVNFDAVGQERQGKADAGVFEAGEFEIIEGNLVELNGKEYRTISDAISAATEGDEIYIVGVHTETLLINKGITLKGNGETIIQAAKSLEEATNRVVTVTSNNGNILLKDLIIRNGHAVNDNGGAIKVEGAYGLFSLENVIIEQNKAGKNGGALSLGGGNIHLYRTWIRDNTSTLSGGGIQILARNATGQDSEVMINESLIQNNTAITTGGGLIIDGNNGYGNNFMTSLEIHSSTFTGNYANETGAMFIKGAKNQDSTGTNIEVLLNHVVIAKNDAVGGRKGISFSGTAVAKPIFNIYNSIVSLNGEDADVDLNFANSATQNVMFNVFGKVNQMVGNSQLVENTVTNKHAKDVLLSDELMMHNNTVPTFTLDGGSLGVDAAGGDWMIEKDVTGYNRIHPDLGPYEYRNLVWRGALSSDANIAGNWNDGYVPVNDEQVYIPKNAVSELKVNESNITLGSVQLQDGATIEVSNNYTLVVSGDVISEEGTINVQSDGTLIIKGENKGQQKVHNSNVFGGLLVQGTKAIDSNQLYVFDADSIEKYGLVNAFFQKENATLNIGEGYKNISENAIIDEGKTIHSNIIVNTPEKFNEEVNSSGINALSNPYTANISYEDLMFYNEENLGAIYLMEENPESGNELQTVSKLGAVGNGMKDWNGYIKMGEGFFAQTKGEAIQLTTDMRIENIRSFEANQNIDESISKVKVTMTSANGNTNETLLGFSTIGSVGFDWGYDAYKQDGQSNSQIYTRMNADNMAIQLFEALENTSTIPLFIDVVEKEEYTLSFDINIPLGYQLFVKDRSTNQIKEISTDDIFTFISDVTQERHRFDLILTKEGLVTSNDDAFTSGNIIVKIDGVEITGLDYRGDNQLNIYTVMGVVLKQQTLTKPEEFVSYRFNKGQVYIIAVTTTEGKIVKKVIF